MRPPHRWVKVKNVIDRKTDRDAIRFCYTIVISCVDVEADPVIGNAPVGA